MNIIQKKLNNNLNTTFVNCPGSKSATVQLWFRTGSSKEKADNRGIAHFLEHMFFKGTPTRPGTKLAHAVESFGGEINAFTSFDYTCYYISTPSNKLDQSVNILLDMLSNPTLKEEDIITEREVVLEEYKRSFDSPDQFNFMELQKSFFGTGYKHPILGTPKTINGFTKDQLIQYRNKNYSTGNALLIVAGDIHNQTNLEKTIEKYHLPSGGVDKSVKFGISKKLKTAFHSKDVEECTLTLVIPCPDYDESVSASEDLAITTLFYGETSPFYKNMVLTHPLATNISGSTMYFNKAGAHFIKISFPAKNFNKVLNTFVKTLSGSLKNKPAPKDIQKIKNQYLASKIYSKESIESFAFSLGHGFAQNGDIYSEEHFLDRIKATNDFNIHIALHDIFKRDVQIQMQTPKISKFQNLDKQLKDFGKKINDAANEGFGEDKTKFQGSHFDEEVKVVELRKGLKFVYRHSPLTPTFVLHTYIKGGVAFETLKDNGIYHFLSRMMSYGPEKMSFEDYKYELENRSAQLSGFSGKNAYGLTAHGQSSDFEFLSNLFFETLYNPSFNKEHINLEKELIKRTLESSKKDPVKQCFSKFTDVVFDKHPYSYDLLGTTKSVAGITRKKLQSLCKKALAEQEMVITFCGDLPFSFIFNRIKEMTKTLPARKSLIRKHTKIPHRKGVRIKIDFDREQSHIMIGRTAFGVGSKDNLMLKMFNTMLSGQSSKLFVEIRDKKSLCYTTQPIHYTALDSGYWGIYIGTSHFKKDQAIDGIVQLLHYYQQHGVSKVEFERVKKIIDGQNQINIQTIDDYANFYSIPILHGLGVDYQHKSFEFMRSVEQEDFNKFLRTFLNFDWNIVEVGKQSKA